MLKKITAVLLIAVMISGACYAIPIDVSGEDFENEACLVTALQIMSNYSDNTFRGEMSVKRGELADIAVKMLGYKADYIESGIYFKDVPTSDKNRNSIYMAAALGIMLGTDEYIFEPDVPIKVNEAATVMVRVLGYGDYANQNGGYSSGHMKVAVQKDILSGLNDGAKTLTRGEAAKMIFNTLTAQRLRQVSFGDTTRFEANDEHTLLKDIFDVYEIEGIAEEDSKANIYSTKPQYSLNDNEIYINGTKIKVDSNTSDMLGKSIKLYARYDEKTQEYTSLYYYDGKDTNVYETDASGAEFKSDRLQIIYTDEITAKDKTLNIDENASVMVNGQYFDRIYAKMAQDLLKTRASGKIRFVDNNGDRRADVIFIKNSVTYVVKSASVSGEIINDRYGNPSLKLDEYDAVEIYDADGKRITLADISMDDILSVEKVSDKSLIRIYRSNKRVKGAVSEIDSDNNVKINNVKYKISEAYTEALKKKYTDEIKIGEDVTAYMDVYGEVGYVKKKSAELYGYVIDLKYETVFGESLKLGIFDSDGVYKVYEPARKVTLVDETCKETEYSEGSGFEKIYKSLLSSDEKVRKLIKFEVNGSGQIKRIELCKNLSSDPNAEYNKTNGFTKYEKGGYYMFNRLFKGKYRITDDTAVMLVPNDNSLKDDYDTAGVSYFQKDTKYDIEIYDLNEMYEPSLIVVNGGSKGLSESTAPAVVKSVSSTLDKEGNTVSSLELYRNKKTYRASGENDIVSESNGKFPEIKITDLQPGDIIQSDASADGEVLKKFRVLFRASYTDEAFNSEEPNTMTSIPNKSLAYAYATLTAVGSDSALFNMNGIKCINNAAEVLTYNKDRDILESDGYSALEVGDKVFVCWIWSGPNMVIKYK